LDAHLKEAVTDRLLLKIRSVRHTPSLKNNAPHAALIPAENKPVFFTDYSFGFSSQKVLK